MGESKLKFGVLFADFEVLFADAIFPSQLKKTYSLSVVFSLLSILLNLSKLALLLAQHKKTKPTIKLAWFTLNNKLSSNMEA